MAKNGFVVGAIHTHPNSDYFSEADKCFARSYNCFIYVAITGRYLKLYHDTRRGYREETAYKKLSYKTVSKKEKKNW